jgi:ABC-type nitrate/sulfonate/bicarbonate transport system substrate-binding protein
MKWKRLSAAIAAAAIGIVVLAACSSSKSSGASGASTVSSAASKGSITIGSPECAHCLAMSLLPGMITGYSTKFETFGTLTDLTAALASGKLDVGQIDYTGLVSFIDKGLPIVAISGEVNGGSDFVLSPSLNLTADDWPSFKALVLKDKAAGKKLKIASSFGTVQDIELRLQLPKYGIDADKDVEFDNVPYQGMGAALQTGSVQAAIPVQPFAAAITSANFGKHFAFPYDQAAGNLTNVVVVSKSFLAAQPDKVAAIAAGMAKLVPYLSTDAGKTAWAAAVVKYDNIAPAQVTEALSQLTPEIGMPFTQVQAIADSMFKQSLTTQDLSAATLQAHMDYGPISKATGKSTTELGAAS